MKVALVEFFLRENRITIFVLRNQDLKSANGPKIITIKIGENNINAVKTMIWGFGRSSIIIEQNLAIFQDIGQAIFKPIVDYLGHCDILYLVPHKNLHYLPFHAIEINGKTLSEHYAIVYLPSASLLGFCQQNNLVRKNKRYYYKQLLSFGVGAREDSVKRRLKFTKEAKLIAETVSTETTSCFLGIKATRAKFFKYVSECDILHIASHGFFDQTSPLRSGLLLAYRNRLPSLTSNKGREKNEVQALDFYQLKLNANLAVFSGCFTGMSNIRPGDELLGLVRGVFAAGVPSMILSLWEAHHDAAIEFFELFYRELNEGIPKALAFQTAQNLLRANVNFKHIKYWAPFLLIGDWL